MKKVRYIATIAAALLWAGSLYARGSYIGGGVGLMSNLGNLGETIMVDGLDSQLAGVPSLTGLPS